MNSVCKHAITAINTILWSAEKLCALLCRIYKTVFPAPRPFPDLIYDNLDKRAEQLLSGYHQSFLDLDLFDGYDDGTCDGKKI